MGMGGEGEGRGIDREEKFLFQALQVLVIAVILCRLS